MGKEEASGRGYGVVLTVLFLTWLPLVYIHYFTHVPRFTFWSFDWWNGWISVTVPTLLGGIIGGRILKSLSTGRLLVVIFLLIAGRLIAGMENGMRWSAKAFLGDTHVYISFLLGLVVARFPGSGKFLLYILLIAGVYIPKYFSQPTRLWVDYFQFLMNRGEIQRDLIAIGAYTGLLLLFCLYTGIVKHTFRKVAPKWLGVSTIITILVMLLLTAAALVIRDIIYTYTLDYKLLTLRGVLISWWAYLSGYYPLVGTISGLGILCELQIRKEELIKYKMKLTDLATGVLGNE